MCVYDREWAVVEDYEKKKTAKNITKADKIIIANKYLHRLKVTVIGD